MRALLLAAGFGTRLRPLTEHTPKCLIQVSGRPLLDYWLVDLHTAGVEEFVVNTHYLSHEVERFVAKHPLRSKITIVHEPILLGTAGTLRANHKFLEQGTTLVAHADNLCLCSWEGFYNAHLFRPKHTFMTMMTFHSPSPRDCGIVEINATGTVIGFHEKVPNPPGNLANAAVYLIEPELVRLVMDMGSSVQDISTQVLPHMLGKIYTWTNNDILVDIGTPERLSSAQIQLSSLTRGNH